MKLKSILTTGLLGLGLATAVHAQEIKLNVPGKTDAPAPAASDAAATPAPAAAEPAFTEAQIVETLGWFAAARMGIHGLDLTPEQIAAFVKGVSAAAAGKDAPYELAKVGPVMNEFVQKRQMTAMAKLKEENDAEAAKFFAELKKKPGVKELPSGLFYEILQPGTGPSPKITDTVKIHYTGTLLSGRVFDSSVARGTPESIGLNEVIPGWTEGLQFINKGGKIKLYIPAKLGYGDQPAGDIPPASTLIFEVELIDFSPAAAATTPAPAPADTK